MKHTLLCLALLATSGCATIVKSERQSVILTGGQENGPTKVRLPDGNYDLSDGRGTILVTRSKEDIPIEVTCNGVTKKGVLPTHFDWAWGGAGNLVFGGIPGWIIDPLNSKGYNVRTPYSVHELCAENRMPAQTNANP